MCTAQNVHTEVPQPRQLAATNITATARLLGADRRKKVHTGGGRFDPSTYQIWANWGAGTDGVPDTCMACMKQVEIPNGHPY